MSLAEECTSHHFHLSPFNPKKLQPNPKPFDEALIRRLKSLSDSLPNSSPSVPLSFLIRAVDLLSSTLADAFALLTDPALSRPESDCFSSHLDASVALLDSLNLVTSRIDRLSRLRLHVSYALHLLSAGDTANTRRARASLAEWTANLRAPQAPHLSAADLVRSGIPPRGKVSALRLAIYAVEAVSALVVGALLSFLGAKADLDRIRVPPELAWSEAFNGVLTAVRRKADGGFAAEIEALDSSVRSLTQATEEAERRVEEVTEGLDRLGSAVNGLFRTALAARDAVLQGFRIQPRKCK